ncbi:O-antigen ligase family protein [Zunongwangia sp. F363]|uniref:O-antigen ligase family protein n=1 Tax=Autumnicola tepida TaxID=3075595 RepID=A0ABU3C7I6_9FLAO|nr:O-antigen ligase family protein [Zunongwangia sp. F363]MDT0642309.1 O-antigen ligase family protein [Zunongwangia sp. F363]
MVIPFLNDLAKSRLSAYEVTAHLIKGLLFYPIPQLLLTPRQLIPIGNQSTDDMVRQLETGLATNTIYLNYLLLLYLSVLTIMLILKSPVKFRINNLKGNHWVFVLILLNVGILSSSFSLNDFIYIFLFAAFLVYSKLNRSHIRTLYNWLLVLYVYSSLILVLLKPAVSIFSDGEWAGIFSNPNGVVIVCNFIFILLLLAPYYGVRRAKVHYLHFIAITLFIFMSDSRNGLLTFAVIGLIFFVSEYKLGIVKNIAILVAFPILFFLVDRFNQIDLVSLTSSRILIWNYAFYELQDNLILGLGRDFYSLDNRLKNFPDTLVFATSSYSSFMDYIVLYGIVGSVAIVMFMRYVFLKAYGIKPVFLIFFVLFLIPNFFESYFRPPYLTINTILYLFVLFILRETLLSRNEIWSDEIEAYPSKL